MTTATTMPAEVAAAINAVMANIKTLGKDDRNKHQGYDFVSTDKFLAAVCPLCADAGLVILQDEESISIASQESTDQYGKTKVQAWLTARYSFVLAHKGGAAYGPLHRTVMVLATGAQAFGSAQSYALKQFLRSLLQISTGDKDDADLQPAEDLPTKQPLRATTAQHRQPAKSEPVPQAGTATTTKRITLDLGEGEVEEFPATPAGAKQTMDRLEELVIQDRWYWNATNRAVADKIVKWLPDFAEQAERIANTNVRMAG